MEKKLVGKTSQCAYCGQAFKVKENAAVMYCKKSHEKAHDLFSGKVERYATG